MEGRSAYPYLGQDPIELSPNRIPFGAKSNEKLDLQSTFGLDSGANLGPWGQGPKKGGAKVSLKYQSTKYRNDYDLLLKTLRIGISSVIYTDFLLSSSQDLCVYFISFSAGRFFPFHAVSCVVPCVSLGVYQI